MVAESDKLVQCFNHVSDENSEILILGTLPPYNRSFYYESDTTFWKILGKAFNCDFSQNKEQKLKNCKIALWDIFKSGYRRNGSSTDNDILLDTVQRNNISKFMIKHPNVKNIIINGKNFAYECFLQHNKEENIQRLIESGNVKKLYNTGTLNRLKNELKTQAESEWIETLEQCCEMSVKKNKRVMVIKKNKNKE